MSTFLLQSVFSNLQLLHSNTVIVEQKNINHALDRILTETTKYWVNTEKIKIWNKPKLESTEIQRDTRKHEK